MTSSPTQDSRLAKVDLFPMFKKSIIAQYPEQDGWKVFNRFNWVSYLHDFVLQRDTSGGAERILVEINTDKVIKDDQIHQMRDVAKRLEHDGTKVTRKILVASNESDRCTIPEDVELCFLQDFLDNGLEAVAMQVSSKKKGGEQKLVA